MSKTIILILIGKRHESAVRVQKVLTDYGCYIKTRLGLHEASETVCSDSGFVILELVGDPGKHGELFEKLTGIPCVEVRMEKMEITNCGG